MNFVVLTLNFFKDIKKMLWNLLTFIYTAGLSDHDDTQQVLEIVNNV